MKFKRSSDDELLKAIEKGGREADDALREIYLANRAVVGQIVLGNQGSEEEAKDLLQEAIIQFIENIRQDKFRRESSISTYLTAIARNRWLDQLRRKKRLREIKQEAITPLLPTDTVTPEESHSPAPDHDQLVIFRTLKTDCQRILIASIYSELTMKAIARKMGYANDQVARNKKYRCLEELKKRIQQNPSLINQLKTK